MRKIVHVDMDAFYASVEQRDRPELKGKPVVVAWTGPRSVVCAASYEARRFGIRSAMAAVTAQRQCPQAIFVPPDFTRYREVSRRVRAIFLRHTALVEPLSLDEAYLDVTEELTGLPTATETARVIRREIREETELTASAGVAPNKFLAKIASDWRKPDGLFVIRPHEVEAFLAPLAVGKLPGVGKATGEALSALGIATVGDLRSRSLVRARGAVREVRPPPARARPGDRRSPRRQRASGQVDLRGRPPSSTTCRSRCCLPRSNAWRSGSGRPPAGASASGGQ